MVRWVFRPYTQIRRAICTLAPLRTSIRVSPDFILSKYSSPSFGSLFIYFNFIPSKKVKSILHEKHYVFHSYLIISFSFQFQDFTCSLILQINKTPWSVLQDGSIYYIFINNLFIILMILINHIIIKFKNLNKIIY